MVTRHITKNTAAQVNSNLIGVLIHPDVESFTGGDLVLRVYQISSTVSIDDVDYHLFRSSKKRVFYCSGVTTTVTVDEADVTFLQMVLFASNQTSGDVDIAWVQRSDVSQIANRDNLYTLDYDPDTQTYSNPQRLNSNETIGFIFRDGYAFDMGPYEYGELTYEHSCNYPAGWVLYDYEKIGSEGYNTFVCRPGMQSFENISPSGLVVGYEDVTFSNITFSVVDDSEMYEWDKDKNIAGEATIQDYDWTIVGIAPKNPSEGDNIYVWSDMAVPEPEEQDTSINVTEVTSVVYDSNSCTVSYSVDGKTWTDVDTVLTDDNNVICNIPKYVYLKFSQDVEITEE